MINVAMVGYKHYPSLGEGDIIMLFPKFFSHPKLRNQFNVCYVGIVEDIDTTDISENVEAMLDSGPNVLSYLNYRDQYNGSQFDKQYLEEVIKKSDIPILLTSGDTYNAQPFAESLDIHFIPGALNLLDFVDYLKKIVPHKE